MGILQRAKLDEICDDGGNAWYETLYELEISGKDSAKVIDILATIDWLSKRHPGADLPVRSLCCCA